MKRLIAVLSCTLLAAAPLALAQDKKAPSKQQERMTACNKQAGDKKGDERKKFMSSCLKGGSAPSASARQKTQQDKMTDCNKQASLKNLKGEERKSFMSSCLKG